MTHEEYVESARERVVDTARSMLEGRLCFIDGARQLASLRNEAAVRDDDVDFMVFVAIASETDDFPTGSARQYWSKDALDKLDPDFKAAQSWAKRVGSEACEALIRRFHAKEFGQQRIAYNGGSPNNHTGADDPGTFASGGPNDTTSDKSHQ